MITDPSSPLAARIAELDARLASLEKQIDEIGMPAAQELQERMAALKIQERALKRNLAESHASGESDALRVAKIEALFDYIATEEEMMEEDAHFLTQAAPSSVSVIARAAARSLEIWQRALHRVLGDRHPLGASAFVNHSHEEIVRGQVPDSGDQAKKN